MSVSALTTAMAVAAATVPAGEPPASEAEFRSESVGVNPGVSAPATALSEAFQPIVLAQAAATPLLKAQQSTELLKAQQSTELAETIDQPAEAGAPSSTQTQSQTPPPPAGGQTEIVVTGRRPSSEDPLEELNATSFKVTQSVDESFIAPIAFTYAKIMPRPVRKGLRNFLNNLGEPVVFLNYLLQLKPGKAAETLGRFAINTTIGVGGVVDVAKRKPFNLPHRENGFANTLGYYGVKPGPYFFLPLIGPTTLRDFIGSRLDLLILPTIFPKVFKRKEIFLPVWILSELGRRVEIDDDLAQIRAARDPYLAMRTYYLQKRQAEIDALHGRGTSTRPPVQVTPPAPPNGGSQPQIPADKTGAPGIGGWVDRQPLGSGGLLGGLSIFGTSSYTRLAGDFTESPIVNVSSIFKEGFAPVEFAYSR